MKVIDWTNDEPVEREFNARYQAHPEGAPEPLNGRRWSDQYADPMDRWPDQPTISGALLGILIASAVAFVVGAGVAAFVIIVLVS